MRGISGFRHDDPRINPYGAVCAGNRITQAVEEDYVFRRYLRMAHLVYTIRKELTGRVDTLGGTIAVRKVISEDFNKDFSHPVGYLFTFMNGVANILPDYLNTVLLQFIGHDDNLAYFINQATTVFSNIKPHKHLNHFKRFYISV